MTRDIDPPDEEQHELPVGTAAEITLQKLREEYLRLCLELISKEQFLRSVHFILKK